MTDKLGELLACDGFLEAEQITGKSYKEDKATEMIGFLQHVAIGEEKRNALRAVDDTQFSEPVSNYLRIAQDEGFEIVLTEEFVGSSEGGIDTMHVLWNDADAILLKFDSYGKNVNGGKFFYNVEFPEWPEERVTSSGHCKKGTNIYVGDHDCREALRYHIAKLRQYGTFVKPWVEIPSSADWFLTYADRKQSPQNWEEAKQYRHELSAPRIAKLPQRVRDATGMM